MPGSRRHQFDLLAELEHDVSVSTGNRAAREPSWPVRGGGGSWLHLCVYDLLLYYFAHRRGEHRQARFLELFGLPSRLCLFSPSLLFLWELATVQLDFQKTSVWARRWIPGYPHTIGATRCVFWHQGWKGGPLSRVRTPTCLHDACSGRTSLAPRPVHPLCLHEVTAASPAFPLRLWTGAESARSADWLGLRHIIYCVVQEGRVRITPRDAHLPGWSWSRCASGSPAPCYHLLLLLLIIILRLSILGSFEKCYVYPSNTSLYSLAYEEFHF